MTGSFLLGLKRAMVDWGFGRREIKVELDGVPGVMIVGGREVMTAGVRGRELVIKWADKAWANWGDLTGSEEYRGLLKAAADKLVRGGGGKAKGKGKAE